MIVNLLDDITERVSRQMSMLEISNQYDAIAKTYARSHSRWLRFAGGEAQCAFEGAVTALLRPGMQMADVACGTGTVARRLLEGLNDNIDLVLLDASKRMLNECQDIPAQHIVGCMTDLPFDTDRFDLLTCAWGIETLSDPKPALVEFVRVTRPGGSICLVFCADQPSRSLVGQALRFNVAHKRRGKFLDSQMMCQLAKDTGAQRVQALHCSGPAAAMILHI